jgi:hypothetical protein
VQPWTSLKLISVQAKDILHRTVFSLFDYRTAKCKKFVSNIQDEHDGWDYDGETLKVTLGRKTVKKYTNEELEELIELF